ncbi:hypothetical protein WG66_000128 [Moniliophthora roreri]|nr:hypothetical protein WG66_000128 [Moniliophthora roreri]
MSPALPIELLREIVQHALYSHTGGLEDGICSRNKPSWNRISSLVSSSKLLRALALEQWFWRLRVHTPEDLLDENLVFSEIKLSWTRELHCTLSDQLQAPPGPWVIEEFKRLNKLRIDWTDPMPADQSFHTTSFQIIPMITELDVRGMEWPSPKVMASIATTFPNLEVLRLQQDTVWCGLCHLCCVPGFKEPGGPTSIIYEGGIGLPVHYAQALSPLAQLRDIILTVGNNGYGDTELDNNKNENIWSGECDECMTTMYSDLTFRGEWVSRKKKVLEVPGKRPPSLKLVEWRFYTVSTFYYDDQPTPTPFD